MNRTRLTAVAVLLFAILGSGKLAGQDKIKLEISSISPNSGAGVYLDRKGMGRTPLSLPYYEPGTYVLMVTTEGMALETQIRIEPGQEVLIAANFDKQSFVVINQNELKYKPIVGKTKLIATSSATGGRPPQPKAEPEPAELEPAKPEPTKPEPKPEPVEDPVPYEPSPPATLPADTAGPLAILQPIPYGPPAPDFLRTPPPAPETQPADTAPPSRPEAPKPKPEPVQIRPRTEPVLTTPKPEPKPDPPAPAPAVHPCPAAPTTACDSFDNGIRGAVYKYYCLLSHQDFDRAYRYRTSTNGLGWFYQVAGSFCSVHGYEIRGFEARTISDTKAIAAYIVDLKDGSGAVIETWQMSATLVKRGDYWLIEGTSGQKIGP